MRKTLLLLLLTAVFCGAFARKTPQVAPAPQVPDSLRGFYLFTEGIKQAFIERDTAAARASLERSVEADSTYGPAWYELAELLLYNDAPAALRHAERAFRTDTTDKWYLLQLGQAQILNDRYRDAIRTYNRLREVDAQNPDSYRVLAMLYDQEGQPFSAIAVLDSAEVRFGRIDALSELKRRLLVGTRQYDRAVAEAQALIEAAPYKAENYLLLGELYARQKKDSLALVQFAEAYRIDSTSVAVLATYSEFYNERRDYASSLNYTRRLFASDEMPLDDKLTYFDRITGDRNFYSTFYLQINDLATTLAMKYPHDPRVVKLYGDHLIASGQLDDALTYYKTHLDDLPPRIMRLHYIEVDTLDGIPVHRRPVSYAVVREAEGRYRLTREEPVGTGRKGYFVAEVTDRRNGVHNTFGVWRVSLAVDGEPRFEYRMDGFTHDLSRCCDAVSCYPMQLGSRNEAIRLARMERSPACFYPVAEERGIVRTAPGEVHRVRIEAEDDCGNRSALEFDIRGRADTFRAKADPAATALRPERTSTLRIGRTAHVTVPAGALYEPLFVRPEIRTAPEAPEGVIVLSPAYRFLDCTTPLRLAATAEIRTDIPRPLQLRTLLAVRNRHGRLSPAGGRCNNGIVRAATRSTGDFVVVADTLPPRVRPLFERGADLSRAEGLRFGAGDNFSGIAAWSLEIDGQWVPCDRFPIKGTLVHFFDTPPARSRHTVRLSVTDACGNTTRCETEFVR